MAPSKHYPQNTLTCYYYTTVLHTTHTIQCRSSGPQTSTHTHTHLLLRKNRNSRSVKMTIIHVSVFNISRPLRVRLSGAER